MEQTYHHSHEQTSGIDIDCIIRDVLKQWWVILIVAIAAALFAGSWKKLTYTPRYTAATTFAVSKAGFSNSLAYDNLRTAETLATRFTQVSGSSVLKKRVCKAMGLDSFDAQVNVWRVPESNLMSMSVTADSPRLAYQMVYTVMDETLALTGEMMDQVAVKVLSEPSVPLAPRNPLDAERTMKKAAVAAAAVMTGIFALMSYFKDTVKNSKEAAAKLDTHMLGTICHERKYKTWKEYARRQKFSLLLTNPAVSFFYTESVQMLATRVRNEMEKRRAKILMVTSVSENEGKSTITANLALALCREGQKVILIDCDFRKPSQYKIFEIEKESKEAGNLTEQLLNSEEMEFWNCKEEKNLLLIGNTRMIQNTMKKETLRKLEAVIQKVSASADYVILDTSPLALVSDGEVIADMAQASILVVQQDVMEARYVNDAIDQLNKTRASVIGYVFNNVKTGIFGRMKVKRYYYGKEYRGYYRYGSRKDKTS